MFIALDVKYRLFFSDFSETECSRQIFEKYLDIKFHENPSSGSPVVPCGQTEGQTDRHDETNSHFFFDILLTVHLNIFILTLTNLMH